MLVKGRLHGILFMMRFIPLTLCLLSVACAQIAQPIDNFKLSGSAARESTTFDQKNGYLLGATATLKNWKAERVADWVSQLAPLDATGKKQVEQFFKRSDVLAALPKGVQIDMGKLQLSAKQEAKDLTLVLEIPRATTEFLPVSNRQPQKTEGVVMRIYSDFECPYCKRLEDMLAKVVPTLPKDLILEFHHVPLEQIHPAARAAAEASECAAQQGKFWPFKDALFAQREWIRTKDFTSIATQQGLNIQTFKKCVSTRAGRQKVDDGLKEAERLGIRGTPTVYIGSFKVSNPYDVSELKRLIDLSRKVERR